MIKPRETTVLQSFHSEAEARMAQLHLEAMGIEAWIEKDDGGGAYPPLQFSNGVHVVIASVDAEAAREILASVAEEEEQIVAAQATARPERSRVWPLFLAGLLTGALLAWGVMDYRQHREANATFEAAFDNTGDGVTDEVHYFEKGQLVRILEDRNSDGKMDDWTFFDGRRITEAFADDNFDGRIDAWFEYADRYNYHYQMDTNFDGQPDVTSHVTDGVIRQADWHPGVSQKIERRVRFDDGVRSAMHVDTDGDGRFDTTVTYDVFERESGRSAYAGEAQRSMPASRQ